MTYDVGRMLSPLRPTPATAGAAGALMAVDLDGAVGLVTGGTNGIGAAVKVPR
jgi:hypothetical protein